MGNDVLEGNESGYDSSVPPSTPSTVSPSPIPNMQAPLPPCSFSRPPLHPSSSKRKADEVKTSSQFAEDTESEPSNHISGSRKSRKLTSPVWDHFSKFEVNGESKAKCIHCDKVLTANTINGTSHLKDHLTRRCSKKNLKVDIRQKLLNVSRKSDGTCSVGTTNFNQEVSRKELANMVIMHEYPLAIVDHVGFRRFVSSLNPSFKIISRPTLRSDIMKMFATEKAGVKKILGNAESKIAITTDMWTASNQKKSYMAVTAHYIDQYWVLRNKTLRRSLLLPCLAEGRTGMMANKDGTKLRIAIIHPDLGIGGAERLIVDAAMELASHGHNVHIFTSHHDRNRCFEETLSGVFPVTVYGDFLPRHIFYRFHAVFAYLRCIFVALCLLLMWPSFDVILADQVSVVIPILKLRSKMKVVFYCHFPDLLLAKHTTLLRKLYRKPIDFIEERTTGMADLILVNSKFTASTFADTFKHLDAGGVRPSVLYPAVNVGQFCKAHASNLNFLSINRFERKKNIDLAISAFARLLTIDGSNVRDVTLTVAGGYDKRLRENVEYLEELKLLAQREGVADRLNFITSCTTHERNTLLSQCLCVLYTPQHEHFGIVPLEAMAAYKPVIGCNSGGPTETIKHEVTGFLCEPTPQEFSLAMSKLIQNPKLAERMGDEARHHVIESFSTKVFGQHLNRFILDVARVKCD